MKMSQRFAETVCCTPADMERRSERDRLTLFHEGERDGDTREREGRIQSNVINSPRFVRFDYSTPVRMHWHAHCVFSFFPLWTCRHVIALFSFLLFFFFQYCFCSFRRSVLLIGEKGGDVKITFFKCDNKNNCLMR